MNETRRTLLAGTGASAALLLASCSSYGDTPPSSAPTAAGGGEIAKTADIPVGGGKIFSDHKVVVTQPSAGTFKGFSSICTHQGCTLSSVENGVINCGCHGSAFKIADGSVVTGPANKELPAVNVKVDGDSIKLG